MEPLLKIENLRVDFSSPSGTIHAVRGVSLSIKRGEILAVVGESGCGKSVLCKSVVGLLSHRAKITGGEILFAGQNLCALTEKEKTRIRGREIAMVFQDPLSSLTPTISIGRQIMEAARIHGGVSLRDAKSKAIRLMKTVGLNDPQRLFSQYPSQLSGGMRQRVAIAIALSCGPKLLIADEPTTALDVTVQAQILQLLRELREKTGISVLLITHDLGVVAQAADRVAVLYAGKVLEIGSVQEVFYDPRHPYTWGLMASLPQARTSQGMLHAIPGGPPDLRFPPKGDPFAPRNPYALQVDYEQEPPMFHVSGTHYAATWLLHPDAPKIKAPVQIQDGQILLREEEKKF